MTFYFRNYIDENDNPTGAKPSLDRVGACNNDPNMVEIVHTRIFNTNFAMDEYIRVNELDIRNPATLEPIEAEQHMTFAESHKDLCERMDEDARRAEHYATLVIHCDGGDIVLKKADAERMKVKS